MRILAEINLEGLARGVKSLQMAWRLFGDILEALKKCTPHVKKDLRKAKRMLAWLNSRIKHFIKARRHPSKSWTFIQMKKIERTVKCDRINTKQFKTAQQGFWGSTLPKASRLIINLVSDTQEQKTCQKVWRDSRWSRVFSEDKSIANILKSDLFVSSRLVEKLEEITHQNLSLWDQYQRNCCKWKCCQGKLRGKWIEMEMNKLPRPDNIKEFWKKSRTVFFKKKPNY